MDGIQLPRHSIISQGPHFHHGGETPIRRYQREPFYFSAILRRGIIFSFFSVPPSFASLLLLSIAMSASKPSLTSVVFSLMPVSFETFLIRLSSMFKVVLIVPSCIYMYQYARLVHMMSRHFQNNAKAHRSRIYRRSGGVILCRAGPSSFVMASDE